MKNKMNAKDYRLYEANTDTYVITYLAPEAEAVLLARSENVEDGSKKCYELLYGRTEPCEFCTCRFNNNAEYILVDEAEENGVFIIDAFSKKTGVPLRTESLVSYRPEYEENMLKHFAESLSYEKQKTLRNPSQAFCLDVPFMPGDFRTWDLQTNIVQCCSLTAGRPGRPIIHKDGFEALFDSGIISSETQGVFKSILSRVEAGDDLVSGTYQVLQKDGCFHWYRTVLKPVKDKNGRVVRAFGVGEDLLTETHTAELFPENMFLLQSEDDDLIFECCIDFTDAKVTQTFPESIVFEYDTFFKERFRSVVGKESQLKLHALFDRARLTESYRNGTDTHCIEYQRVTDNGRIAWAELTLLLLPVTKTEQQLGILKVRNIDKRKKLEFSLTESAKKDVLTGTYTVETFRAMVNSMTEKSHLDGGCFISICLSNLQAIKGLYNEKYADRVIKEFVKILKSCVDEKTLICRSDYNEFLLYLNTNKDVQAVEDDLLRLRRLFSLNFNREDTRFLVEVYAGVVFNEKPNENFDTLLAKAEHMLGLAMNSRSSAYKIYDADQDVKNSHDKKFTTDTLFNAFVVLDAQTGEELWSSLPHQRGAEATLLNHTVRGGQLEHIRRIHPELDAKETSEFIISQEPQTASVYKKIVFDGRPAWQIYLLNTEPDPEAEDRFIWEEVFKIIEPIGNGQPFSQAIDPILLQLMRIHDGSKALFMITDKSGNPVQIYETTAGGTAAIKDSLSHHRLGIKKFFKSLPKKQACFNAAETEEAEIKEFLTSQNIASVYTLSDDCMKSHTAHFMICNPKRTTGRARLLWSVLPFVTHAYEQQEKDKKAEYLKTHDSFTGLENRFSFMKLRDAIVAENLNSIGVIQLDINNLKNYNNLYGYSYGDRMLRGVAKALNNCFGEDHVYRIEGDEFLVVCIDISKEHFQKSKDKADKELTAFKKNLVSFGSVWASSELDLDKMIVQANELLDAEKEKVYSESDVGGTHDFSGSREELMRELKEGRYQVYLQPQVTVADERLVGAEALIRYIDPELGVRSPAAFVPKYERLGLIYIIDMFVFDRVCASIQEWLKHDPLPFRIAVNFSRSTILKPDIVGSVTRLIGQYGIPAEYIEIEVTETIGDMNQQALADISERLRRTGFAISLDDFGSRYSSMSILSIMDFDTLKIDKSLIDTIVINDRAAKTVETCILFCKKLGFTCLAEGVETASQLDVLKKLGCDLIQGYYTDKPVPTHVFENRYMQTLFKH